MEFILILLGFGLIFLLLYYLVKISEDLGTNKEIIKTNEKIISDKQKDLEIASRPESSADDILDWMRKKK